MVIKFRTVDAIAIAVIGDILVPLIALGLGVFVVALRPRDRNAWLVLILVIGFMEVASRDYGLPTTFRTSWSAVWSSLWPVFMMLFGIYFPERSAYDRKRPWLKYLLLVPCVLIEISVAAILLIWRHDINTALPLRPMLIRLAFAQSIVGMLAIGVFFMILGIKTGTETSADSRRRLRILQVGSSVGLTPTFLLVLYGLARRRDLFSGVPWPLIAVATGFLSIFPLTLAYVIVVERAMDLRFVIRRGIQYSLARVGYRVARATLLIAAVYLFTTAASRKDAGPSMPIALGAVGIGLLVLRRRTADQASQWVDRKFFREAYDAEKVLSEFASEAGRYVEIKPLLENTAERISDTLHVPDIVILLQDGQEFVPRCSTRPGEPMNIAADGRIAKNLRERDGPLEIYFDTPPLWLRSLSAEELQTLDFMRTEVLLPLSGRNQLAGIMSLGPKLSESPYSETDLRLLDAIASQMGLAVENSRLLVSLAEEAALRDRANRELEIAREVQERLFPQDYPAISGLDYAGYCRPARGVGGDYYDFLQLEDGTLGIAVGDVSGKGIAAALLMATLRASLRGQAMAGVHDLSALMHNVNRLVYEASTSNRYATFFYAEYELSSRCMRFVNAGHNPPVILRGDRVIRLEACGPVVGLLPGALYRQDECRLQPGDIFIAFTDGISEAMNERDEEWEEERFIAAARRAAGLKATQIIDAIFREADAFTGPARQYDDMTLLVMKLAR